MGENAYDVIVIGAGAVGENVADRAVQGGLSAVIVESELVGGECSYWACMPSKALLRAGSALRAARDVRGAAQAVTGRVDPAEVFARRDAVTHDGDDSSQVAWLNGAHIDLVRGHARFTGPKAVRVEASDGTITELRARHAVVVSTGSDPLLPDVAGLAEARPWTSRDATSAQSAPASLAILGGGVVACEMATAYASFGTAVTLLVRGGALLAGQEPFAGELVQAGLEKAGVTIRFGTQAASARRTDAGVELTLADGGALTAQEVLVAIGRTPRTADLGLETIGLAPGDWLHVDDTLRVDGVDWLYATGDVNHRALLTHQGKYQARGAGDVIAARAKGEPVDDDRWGRHVATADHAAVPQVVFGEPEVVAVGLTEAAAREAGHRVRTVEVEFSSVAGASLHADGYRGRAHMVVDEERQVLLGVTMVGSDVAELVHAATIAVVGEVPLARLWHAVPSYPTMSEVWLRLLEAYGRQSA